RAWPDALGRQVRGAGERYPRPLEARAASVASRRDDVLRVEEGVDSGGRKPAEVRSWDRADDGRIAHSPWRRWRDAAVPRCTSRAAEQIAAAQFPGSD